ncbi:zinc ribbon-containing protein [Parashewanella tropica]|uniref:zinc ribbon-containing protein n=1 Tax=Parashewanella tropica TaxID=2547970 RepID=UPI0010599F02|nr:zinc ribbon-containing protein [Parashewanella tropica]
MTEKSQALLDLYQQLIQQVKQEYENDTSLTVNDLMQSVEQGATFLSMKDDIDETELDLVKAFLHREISEFVKHQHEQDISTSPTFLMLENSLFHWLGEITDRSQVEWHELSKELKQAGTYKAGEIVSQGRMICEDCGHGMDIEFPSIISSCPECDSTEFIRQPLNP